MVLTRTGGAELFMWNWHEKERRKAAERRAKAAAAPSTIGITKQPGGGGDVMPKRLKCLGLAIIVLIVAGLPTAVTKLRKSSLPFSPCCVLSLVPFYDALDPFYKPNAVFIQFLGSASMTGFFLFLPLLPLNVSHFLLFFFSFFPIFGRFLPFFLLSFLFLIVLCFFFLNDLRLPCVCVVIDTTRNVYMVVFLG